MKALIYLLFMEIVKLCWNSISENSPLDYSTTRTVTSTSTSLRTNYACPFLVGLCAQ